MSLYVTCVKNNNCISGIVSPSLNLPVKYEMALVECYIPDQLTIDRGYIRVYNTLTKSIVSILNLNIAQSLDSLSKMAKALSISTQVHDNFLVLKAGESQVFKADQEAQKSLSLKTEYSNALTVDGNLFTRISIAHLHCNIIAEQILGNRKRAILRTLNMLKPHQIFSMPHYVDVNSTSISHINMCLRDENDDELNLVGKIIFKVHLKPKR